MGIQHILAISMNMLFYLFLGDTVSRLTSDTTTMSNATTMSNIFLRTIVKIIGICVFMFSLSWRLSVVTLLGLPVFVGLSEVYGKYVKVISAIQ